MYASSTLSIAASWSLLVLGISHVLYGMGKYRYHFLEILREGFIGRFGATESRRTGFWFVMFGIQLLLAGHIRNVSTCFGHLIQS